MKPYSLDLRQRILAAVDAGQLTRTALAKTFSVSTAWIRRLVQRRRDTGSILPKDGRRGPRPKLDALRLERLRELVQQQPDATLAELRERLAAPVSVMTVARALQALRLPLKKSPNTPPSRRGRTCSSSGVNTKRRSRGSLRDV